MSESLVIKDFRTLKVWQKANSLEQEIGELVKGFPGYEQYRLTDQLIRASRSIGANIAEGNTQLFIKRELFHANSALGSAGECRNHLLTAYQNDYINREQYDALDKMLIEIIKMLFGYIKGLKSNSDNESDAATNW
ncbi:MULTISPECIES: four helix bundle protein [Thermoanaerobacterium]|uniref:S23 ribosomal protein n=2 Tax=Thermoanaerobacterium TaxID=28895 RepID=W9EDF5_9THEO|nr:MULTISPECIES: four helix bundle protein [Thermoanaerobacterium]AFK86090.1 S23 ribosomal protein [Thermoanaerobacterium saccharolyticum JW/SL-YS485]ETO39020.1 S23 ribosomal protein [Thermoanaerobacterium aotearoense SCUT27]